MKKRIAKIKRLQGPQLLTPSDFDIDKGVIDLLRRMGYFIYNNPGNEDIGEIIVSDRTMTYGDCRRYHKRLGIDLDWWKEDSGFVEMEDQELEEA